MECSACLEYREKKKSESLMEFQTHHLSDTRQEPKYSVLFGETCGELTKSLLGSYM